MNYAALVAQFSRMAEEKGMVNSLEGNLSMIDRQTGNIYITPSHKAKSLLTPEMICVVSPEGEQIGGTGTFWDTIFYGETIGIPNIILLVILLIAVVIFMALN